MITHTVRTPDLTVTISVFITIFFVIDAQLMFKLNTELLKCLMNFSCQTEPKALIIGSFSISETYSNLKVEVGTSFLLLCYPCPHFSSYRVHRQTLLWGKLEIFAAATPVKSEYCFSSEGKEI